MGADISDRLELSKSSTGRAVSVDTAARKQLLV